MRSTTSAVEVNRVQGLRRREALTVSAAALALAGCAGGGNEMRHERREVEAGGAGETLVVDGAPLHFVRRGSGPPVVLIHGASGNLRDWSMSALPAIAERHDTVAFDRPGHGLSGWPGSSAIRLGDQARRMRQALRQVGVERAIVVGHSYGGSVALAWALDAPETVAGLLLIASPSQVWPGGLGLSTGLLASPVTGPLLAQALPAVLPRSVARMAVETVFAPQAPPPGYIDALGVGLVLRPGALRANARQLAALKDQIRVMVPLYPGLAMPVELIHGTADEIVPMAIHSEPLSRQVPQARLTRLEGVGHMPHHVALATVLEALDRLGG